MAVRPKLHNNALATVSTHKLSHSRTLNYVFIVYALYQQLKAVFGKIGTEMYIHYTAAWHRIQSTKVNYYYTAMEQ
jgi:hypothetical protein